MPMIYVSEDLLEQGNGIVRSMALHCHQYTTALQWDRCDVSRVP